MNKLDNLTINTLRFLAVDMVERARSGHPGLPLGAAPMAYILWDRFLRVNPLNPAWFNRDRFILSAGHGSALLYALLHLYGYDLPLDELKRFRQWGSLTPGHPEAGLTPGVEVTTGPLGQGLAMGIGMAMAEKYLAQMFNRPDFPLVDHHTYALVSDGDLMEGLSSEAASLAGHLKLGKLIYLYDSNRVTIEGSTALAFTENVAMRFEAYGWHVPSVADGNGLDAITTALQVAQADPRPSLIIVSTHIGFGSPKQDSAAAHGEPLGGAAVIATKAKLNWPSQPEFYIPPEVREHCYQATTRGQQWEAEWQAVWDGYQKEYPALAGDFERAIKSELPSDWDANLPSFPAGGKPLSTRGASSKVLNALAKKIPALIGGSADLGPSNKTVLEGQSDFTADQAGRNIHFGVREHAMMAALNGLAKHGGVIPYGGTFLVFSDYMRPALRLAALMQTRVILIFSHDSIGLGEDGPTHQPIEHLASLRALPGLTVIRPADAYETVAAWKVALTRPGPVALILTRQDVPVLDPTFFLMAEGLPRGAYILREAVGSPLDLVLIATGSEVHLILSAQEILEKRGLRVRSVSLPSWELFDEQPREYREEIFPSETPKLAVEAGSTLGWSRYVGDRGEVMGLDQFGASAPGEVLFDKLGFTVNSIVERALKLLKLY